MGLKKNQVYSGSSDIDKPGTWRLYKKGICATCFGTCCTLIVEVTAKDLIRLGFTDEWEVENCFKDLIRNLKKQGIIKRYNFKNQKFTLMQKNGNDCFFMNRDRLCSVYEKRPEVCRNHPVHAGPRKGYCPYIPK